MMINFEYYEFSDARSEIRLLHLLPGTKNDPLKLTIAHCTLPDPPAAGHSTTALNIPDIQRSLPQGWSVEETLEHRFLFICEATDATSWVHPDPQFDQSRLRTDPELPTPDFQPQFEALSYTWGSPEDQDTIMLAYSESRPSSVSVEDQLPIFRSLRITRNLGDALRHLRLANSSRTLWIDAICINQADNDEKSLQIVRMSTLYRMAQRVVQWIGPQNPGSSSALAVLQHIGKQMELGRNLIRYPAPGATESEWYLAVCPLPYTSQTWEAIQDVMERPYFERLWIMQEVMLANGKAIIVCGQDEIPWYYFVRALLCLASKMDLQGSVKLRERLEAARTLTWNHADFSVAFALRLSRSLKCFDPRDKVYGILGITTQAFTEKLKPDYRMPVKDVYTEAVLTCLEHEQRLSLLQDCEMVQGQHDGPSWVPDLSIPQRTFPMSAFVLASGMSRSCARFIEPNILEVTGRVFGVVSNMSLPAPDVPTEVLAHLSSWEPQGLFSDSYAAGGSLLDAYLMTLRVGYVGERWEAFNEITMDEWRDKYMAMLHPESAGAHRLAEIENGDVWWATRLIKRRTLITTKDGFIGLGPPGALTGDILCAILGCKASMMLRKTSDDFYRVVGECYVHGMDESVALLGRMPPGWSMRIAKDSCGYAEYRYKNTLTGEIRSQDPRLPDLPRPWHAVHLERLPGDPSIWECYQNEVTGELLNTDPRLLPDALRQQGIPLQEFRLV